MDQTNSSTPASKQKRPRRTEGERQASKLAQMEKLKAEIAALDDAKAMRVGRIAVKAGLGDVPPAELAKEFEELARRFHAKP